MKNPSFDILFCCFYDNTATGEEQTGCITCLESCPIGITSNAAYPAISSLKRMISPNSQFKGKAEKLPRQGNLILIYSK